MDDLDRALIEAWHRVHRAMAADPAEAARRGARVRMHAGAKPIRPWCLCIRACDTRIHTKHWQVADDDLDSKNPHPPHYVYLDAPRLRELVKPVDIDWPGIDWELAAARLGRHSESLRGWLAAGVFKVARHNARSVGKRGYPVPFVYTHTPLDPNAERGRAPDRIWGHIWQTLHERIPDGFEQVLQRIPRMRYYKGGNTPRFRGWRFICQGCKRPVDNLYYPLAVWTLGDMLEGKSGTSVPESPDERDMGCKPMPRREFGCARCHGVGYVSLMEQGGWNRFITHISGGVLSGRDVARRQLGHMPETRSIRRRAYRPLRVPKQSPGTLVAGEGVALSARRREVLDLLVRGHTYGYIAGRLNTSYHVVRHHACMIYREYGVSTRAAFFRAVAEPIGSQARTPPGARLREVAELLVNGRSNAEVAGALGIALTAVQGRICRLYRCYGLHKRRELLAALRAEALHAAA